MVLSGISVDPEHQQACISVRIHTQQPHLSVATLESSDPSSPILNINITARCTASTQPSQPLTIEVSGLILDATHGDKLAQGMLGGGLVRVHPPSPPKHVSLGFLRMHRARQEGDDATDLRERPGAAFLTVPPYDAAEEVTVTYELSRERLFRYADGLTAEDLSVGERYRLSLHEGHVGCNWWCWGGLDGKRPHCFEKGVLGEIDREVTGREAPSEEEREREGWVIGEDREQLEFAVKEDGGSCELEIVP